MNTFENLPDSLLKEFQENLKIKVQSEIQKNKAFSKDEPTQEYSQLFKEYTKRSIDLLKKVQDQHDINLSFKALELYYTNELEQSTTTVEKNYNKKALKEIQECKGKIKDVQNPIYYATLFNNTGQLYKNGLPKDVVTLTLKAEIKRTNSCCETYRADILNTEFYKALNVFIKSFYKDYEMEQEKVRLFHKAKEEGIIKALEKLSSKEFNTQFPHLKVFGDKLKDLENKLEEIEANEKIQSGVDQISKEDIKSALNQVTRENIIQDFANFISKEA